MKHINLPVVAVGAVLFRDNKVLLVRRKNPPAKGQWAVPGGKVLAGEKLQEALVREIQEETGLLIKVADLVYVFDVIEKDQSGALLFHYVIIDYLCEYLSGVVKAGDDAAEVGWFSGEELSRMQINPNTKKLLIEKFHFGGNKTD